MNIVKELRKRKGIQQKELAIIAGVAQPTVSEWELNKKDPSGERLKRLADYFGVDELVILGKGVIDLCEKKDGITTFPKIEGVSETEIIKQYVLAGLAPQHSSTPEALELVTGIDKLSKEQQGALLTVAKAMFSEVFDEETQNDSRL